MILRKLIYPLIMFGLLSCEKEGENLHTSVDYNKLTYVIADNYNFGTFSKILKYTGQDDLLAGDEKFTVLAPGDDAFIKGGYDTATVFSEPKDFLQNLVNFHVLPGEYELDKLPLKFNQELSSLGGPLYVTRWAKDGDTVLTINGKQMLLPKNTKTSNGILQIVDVTINTVSHETLYDAVMAVDSLTLFAYMLEHAGLKDKFSSSAQNLTLFAPGNFSMKRFGITSLKDIKEMSQAEANEFVLFHTMAGRKFEKDFVLTLQSPVTSGAVVVFNPLTATYTTVSKGTYTDQTTYMYNGGQITLSVEQGTVSGTVYTHFKFKDVRGERVNIANPDIPAKNGVLHIIDDVLRSKK